MGCSPSKGQVFSKKAELSGLHKSTTDLLADHREAGGLETAIQDNTMSIQGKRSSVDDVVCNVTVTMKEGGCEGDVIGQRRSSQDRQIEQEGLFQNKNKQKDEKNNNKAGKRRKQRKHGLRNTFYVQSKAEFILKAHQAAYAYLNPSIAKYESLLGLLDQAAQTSLSLQTMVSSVVSDYEEINQALDEMAAEGELMLRKHGHHMNWSTSLKDNLLATAQSSSELNSSDLPSELLMQRLYQTTEKMISVGGSVKSLGDSSLQELVDYFGSLSLLLSEKLLTKHVVEERLKQVIAHVEAALQKPNPEDSALHSEDSGIGADNECLNGSERLCRHQDSSGSGANAIITSFCTTSSSLDQQLLNNHEEATDNNDDGEIRAKDKQGVLTEKMSETSSKADSSSPLFQTVLDHVLASDNLKRKDLSKKKLRRPKTADNTCQVKPKHWGPKRSQSTECLFKTVEEFDLDEQQDNLRNKQMAGWRSKNLSGERVHGSHIQTKLRRCSSGGQSAARYYGLQYGSKGPCRAMPPSPLLFTPDPPGRNAVKKLINTFSQGVVKSSSPQSQKKNPLDQRSMEYNGNQKCGLPLLNSRRVLTTNCNMKSSIHQNEPRLADSTEHLDMESLPPPPIEILMDNSFQSSLGMPGEERPKVIHLSHSSARTDLANVSIQRSPHQECISQYEGETPALYPRCFPPMTSPNSRKQLSSTCPSVHHTVPSPPSIACPSSGKWTASTTPIASCRYRWTMAEENNLPASSSQSFFEARALFCQENQSFPHSLKPSCTSTLPRPWGEVARGRLLTCYPQPYFKRCSSSNHRSVHTEQQQSCPNAKQQQCQGSDVTVMTTKGSNIVSVMPESNSSDQAITTSCSLTDGQLYTNLNTNSMLVGEEITD